MNEELEAKDEKIFELNEEIKRLRNQVTYLQEELASAEDVIEQMKIDQAGEDW